MSAAAVAHAPAHSASDLHTGVSGSTHIREQVIEKVVREASAAAIGIARSDVDVEVAEWGEGLAVRITSKLPIPALDDTEAIQAETPLVERVRALQASLTEQLATLTGRKIQRVSFVVTGAIIPERKRVR
ncbi:NTP pyrophosphohydrolase [Leucobacter sp. HY1908]